jgi:mono/diheme cytochrome c family protein
MKNLTTLTGTALMLVSSLAAGQDTGAGEARGELLYSTYCVACHTTEAHWRDDKLATNWAGLKFQVRRWQANIGLGLGEDDVGAIASYLNGLFYHYSETDAEQAGKADPAPRVASLRPD